MQNGIPYWYFYKHGGELEGTCVKSVDPHGSILKRIPPERVIGCVVYPASELIAPGWSGWSKRTVSDRRARRQHQPPRERGVRMLHTRRLQAPVLDNIRAEIWLSCGAT